jgi:hypothetical protein
MLTHMERFKMSAPQSVSSATPQAVTGTSSPNQYHLHGSHLLGHSIRISYYPDGAGLLTPDGPIILAYQDAHRSLIFRGKAAQVAPVADFGTCVTVTLQKPIDADWTTATLLVPNVVLAAGQSTTVQTELITTVHNGALSGFGHPQRDHYTVTPLTGEASEGPLPL